MDLLFLLLLLPSILTLSTLALHHIRVLRKRRQDRAPLAVVQALETRVWTPDGWEKDDESSSDTSSITSSTSRPTSPSARDESSRAKPISKARMAVVAQSNEGEASTSYTSTSPLVTEPGVTVASEDAATSGSLDSTRTKNTKRTGKSSLVPPKPKYYSTQEVRDDTCLKVFLDLILDLISTLTLHMRLVLDLS